MTGARSIAGWVLALVLGAAPSAAHDFRLTDTLLLLKADGTFQVDLVCDLDALALGAAPGADNAELAERLRALPEDDLAARLADLRRMFERRIRVRFDGTPAAFSISFPERGAPPAPRAPAPTYLGTLARLSGSVPEGAATVTFFASRAFPDVHLTILDQRALGGTRQILERGAVSPPYRLDGPSEEPVARTAVVTQYLALGFRHIVPDGVDHILFVLGLFLLAVRWRPLLWQVSAFTAAHTLTLALSIYGVVELPARIVEPLIALSIAWVAIENTVTSELKSWRPFMVFAFGLLHGLGFAGVLRELGLPASERLPALLAFNGGVELGQLAVLGLAWLALGAFAQRPWYRERVTIPLSLAIAAVGLYWFVSRALG